MIIVTQMSSPAAGYQTNQVVVFYLHNTDTCFNLTSPPEEAGRGAAPSHVGVVGAKLGPGGPEQRQNNSQ